MAGTKDLNENDLPNEAKVVTQSFLEETLKCAQQREDIIVKDFSVAMATTKGENFASVVFRVNVTSQEGKKEKTHHLIVKTMHDSEFLHKLTTKMKIVDKEIMAYKELCPTFIQYQTDKGLEPICPPVPTFYHGILNDTKGIVVLQDLSPEGYKNADRRKGLDYDHCKLAMIELAKFHALSYAMKEGNLENLKEKFGLACIETIYSTENKTDTEPMLQNGIKTAVDMIKAVGEEEETKDYITKLQNLPIFSTMQAALKPEEPYSVICHGDAWCNNMIFKYGNGEDNAPTDIKLLDLQVVRYSLPTTDLAYFFFTSTTRSLRKTHLNDLLQLYHKSFIDTLNHVNVTVPHFTFEMLQSMFKKTMMFGVISACMMLPALLSISSDLPDIKDQQTKEDFHKMGENIVKKVINGNSKILVHERLVGAIQDAVDAGMM